MYNDLYRVLARVQRHFLNIILHSYMYMYIYVLWMKTSACPRVTLLIHSQY